MKVLIFCILSMALMQFELHAQNEVIYDTILLLTHKEKGKTKYLVKGKKITHWKKVDGAKNKGRLEGIKENKLLIDGVEYDFEDFKQIRAKSSGLKVIQISGKVVMATGTLVTVLGGYWIFYGYSIAGSDACGSGILIVFGVLAASVGIASVIIGSIPLLFSGKKFDMDLWDMEMQLVPDKKAKRKLARQQKKEVLE